MPLSDEQKKAFRAIFDKYDATKTGCLTFPQFAEFMHFVISKEDQIVAARDGWYEDVNDKMLKFFFDGIATESRNSVTIDEVVNALEKLRENNEDYIVRLVFKSMDPDRTDHVSSTKLIESSEIFGFKFNVGYGEGGITGISFSDFYQMVTGKSPDEVPPVSSRKDPETGDLADQSKKSTCCNLL